MHVFKNVGLVEQLGTGSFRQEREMFLLINGVAMKMAMIIAMK